MPAAVSLDLSEDVLDIMDITPVGGRGTLSDLSPHFSEQRFEFSSAIREQPQPFAHDFAFRRVLA